MTIGGPAAPWEDLGLTIGADGAIAIGGVALAFAGEGSGIRGWSLAGLGGAFTDLDGLDTTASDAPEAPGEEHPLGAIAIDHVVALTGDLDRTAGVLQDAGLDHRRTRDAGGGRRQAFFLVRPTLLELAGPVEGHDRAAFWGLTVAVADLDRAAEHLGDRLGQVKDAVQPGRRIATVRPEAGLGVPVALISPRH